MILGEAVLFPMAMLRLRIFEPRYKRMLQDSLASHRLFCVAMQRPGGKRESPMPVAGLGLVRVATRNDDGTYHIVLQGLARVRLSGASRYKPYRVHPIVPVLCPKEVPPAVDALRYRLMDIVEKKFNLDPPVPDGFFRSFAKAGGKGNPWDGCMAALRSISHPGQLADIITLLLVEDPLFKQLILQSEDLGQRYRNLICVLEGLMPGHGMHGMDEGNDDGEDNADGAGSQG